MAWHLPTHHSSPLPQFLSCLTLRMAYPNSVTTIDVCRVAPSLDSPASASEFSLPITTLDILWFKFDPVERIFFYELTESTPRVFNSDIIPKLKHSLSLTLPHFLPVAGNLVWPPNSTIPIILYTPNDSVSFTVAESNADFRRISSHETRKAAESLAYIPGLEISESKASIISFKITNFPNQGFCIGISSHHAVMDGKSATMFIKAWAQISKQVHQLSIKEAQLSLDLTPFYDRTQTQDPEEVTIDFLNLWSNSDWPDLDIGPRSLNIMPANPPKQEMVRAAFELSGQDIEKLREKMVSQLNEPIRLSSFVIALAYAIVCRVKAKSGKELGKRVMYMIAADFRERYHPPLPGNYFGNCVGGFPVSVKDAAVEDVGPALVAKEISELIKGLEKGAVERSKRGFKRMFENGATEEEEGSGVELEVIGTAGSPRFGVYEVDFGWGRPVMVEIASVGRTSAISLAESRGGDGGIEIGLALKKQEMKSFENLFVNGLKFPTN